MSIMNYIHLYSPKEETDKNTYIQKYTTNRNGSRNKE